MQHLLRLRTLHTRLAQEAARPYQAIVLDEGPVFSLCRLRLFRKATHRITRPQGWSTTLSPWGGVLDLVIWLDAPDLVLAQRIRNRPKDHEVKDSTERDIHEFLGRFRSTYREILTEMTADGRMQVVEFDTARDSADQIADAALAAMARVSGQHGRTGVR